MIDFTDDDVMPLFDAYDGIEHLAKSVSGGRDWREVAIAVYTAYFDASGHEGKEDGKCSSVLVVAGFIANTDHWVEFNNKWEGQLIAAGKKEFHASKEKHNTSLKLLLIDTIKSVGPAKFGVAVKLPALQKMPRDMRDKYYLRAYALGGRSVVQQTLKWCRSFHSRYVPEIIFESGDAGADELEKRLVLDGFPRPIFKPKKDRVLPGGSIEKGILALQAADLFANEMFRCCLVGNPDSPEMQELMRIQSGHMVGYTEEEMEDFEMQLKTMDATRYLDELKPHNKS